jgi:Putative zinc-finger
MDCRRVDERLPAYVEDALPSRQARAVTAHLGVCPRCRRERRVLEMALGALDRVGRRRPEIDLWGSFADRLAAEQAASPRSILGGTVALRRPFALAGSLALAVGACFLGLLAGGLRSPDLPSPATHRGERNPVAWRGWAPLASGDREEASPALRALPPVQSPEHRIAAARPMVAVVELPPRRMALVAANSQLAAKNAAHPLKPVRTQLAVIPSAELAAVADALINAQEDAARAQVASEVILLAKEMVRVSAPRDESIEGRS